MMDMIITPSKLSGTMDAISSKSFMHRLLICAALSGKETVIHLTCLSEDIHATIRCLEAMGCSVKVDRKELLVKPIPVSDAETKAKAGTSRVVLDCGESGSTARFLLPLAAHFFDEFTLTGTGKLPRRPFAPLCETLTNAGCSFESDQLPMNGRGGMRPGDFHISGDISSQFISGLLFVLPLLGGDSRIVVTTPVESSGYVDMTVEVIAMFGIAVEKGKTCPETGTYELHINGNRRYDSPGVVTAEGDWSNAAFFLCMGAIGETGNAISMRGLSPRSEQGDKGIIEILRCFGAKTKVTKTVADGTLVTVGGGTLKGIEIDAAQIPDLVPTLAAVASVSAGETRIYNARRIRFKESDRIQTTYNMLSGLGADIRIIDDGFLIRGKKKLHGGVVDGAGDHRIVMAAATAACACEGPVVIKGYEAINKSYPSFFGDFRSLGGIANVI